MRILRFIKLLTKDFVAVLITVLKALRFFIFSIMFSVPMIVSYNYLSINWIKSCAIVWALVATTEAIITIDNHNLSAIEIVVNKGTTKVFSWLKTKWEMTEKKQLKPEKVSYRDINYNDKKFIPHGWME